MLGDIRPALCIALVLLIKTVPIQYTVHVTQRNMDDKYGI